MYTVVEIALLVMISVWTLVSLGLGVLSYMLYAQVRVAVDRVNQLLATGQHVADDVRAPIQAVSESVREVFGTPQTREPLPTV